MEYQFTKYEIARIIGARALQIATDAPLLLKIADKELKEMKYDPIKIAEKEFQEGVLPIAINRPLPRRKKDKLTAIKEENVSDEELVAKEQEVEKDIVENATEMGLVQPEDEEALDLETGGSEEQ
ncbi:MAG: DNA-directed RNA polymerase subunit K [Nanoarchaeota archaeon]|nr:DNA-directed RNA polymerase subunit K [Nanoarchaeota archaeon]